MNRVYQFSLVPDSAFSPNKFERYKWYKWEIVWLRVERLRLRWVIDDLYPTKKLNIPALVQFR